MRQREGWKMELLQLKYFTAVVQAGTINGAARRLGMTQPPVSTQIRLLEKELGCTLFQRGSRSIELTEEGRLLYEHAIRILNMTKSAQDAVQDCHSAETGTLRIGVVSSLADFAVEKWFKGFSCRYPLVDFELSEGTTYELLDKLRSRLLDVALVRTPFSKRGLETISLEPEEMLLIGTEKYMNDLPDKVSLLQVSRCPLILYRRWAGFLDQEFAKRGYKTRVLCLADDARTCVSWAAAGLGAAVAPADISSAGSMTGLMTRVIRGLPAQAETTLAVNEGSCDTAVGMKFIEFFRESSLKTEEKK